MNNSVDLADQGRLSARIAPATAPRRAATGAELGCLSGVQVEQPVDVGAFEEIMNVLIELIGPRVAQLRPAVAVHRRAVTEHQQANRLGCRTDYFGSPSTALGG
jgi:hypothetical protein